MSTPPKTVYLISGATRGIGLALVTTLATRPHTLIFAGARDPPSSTSLQALAAQHPHTVRIVKLTSGDAEENAEAVAEVGRVAGRLDVVIANAGISKFYGLARETPAGEMREHYEVNVVGTLVLFQAFTAPLGTTARPHPKFVAISSFGGSIAVGATLPGVGIAAYGASKAALNYLVRRINAENEFLVSFAIHPGRVTSDMAAFAKETNKATTDGGSAKMPFITPAESAQGILAVVDGATRAETGGAFVSYDGGKTLPW
ncbi:hypothetical protein PLICRDRAFT_160008 [Plicaturopsis crispa FD-325 SS-3]|nr:hypothetical protein PLICRDRAFT_160008 [Plicaturopsis crispa FD-325 SS-3]